MNRFLLIFFITSICFKVYGQVPSVNSFAPSFGPAGTLITINGNNLDNGKVSIAGRSAVTVSSSPSKLVVMVMPGSVTGAISIDNGKGTAISGSKFTLQPTPYPSIQQGSRLVGAKAVGPATQGNAVAISADGNTVAIGGITDNKDIGAVWVFKRTGTTWDQEGDKILPNDATISLNKQLIFGYSMAFSADGNTLIVGGTQDMQAGQGVGAVWVFVRANGIWKQQGNKLIGTGNAGSSLQGSDVALSADGNTAVVHGLGDDYFRGALWVFTRTGGVWTQQGPKLVPSGLSDVKQQGGGNFHSCIALSADGNTILTSGYTNLTGPVAQAIGILFSRNNGIWAEQSERLKVAGGTQGRAVALNADATVAMIGGPLDDGQKGGAWIFTKNGNSWVQQGPKLIGPGADSESSQGTSVTLSADGNTAIMGEYGPGKHYRGGIWVFTRKGNSWNLQGKQLVGYDTDQYSLSGTSVSISADGKTSVNGGGSHNNREGAAWIFSEASATPPLATTLPATQVSFSQAAINGTAADNGSQTSVILEYSTEPDLTGSVIAPLTIGGSPIDAGTGTVTFASNLTNLKPSTTYYFRISAVNGGGEVNGNILSFTTSAKTLNPPTAVTRAATLVALTSATLNGIVDDRGSLTSVSFELSTSPTLAGSNSVPVTTGVNPIAANTGPVNFTSEVKTLSPGVTYYFRINSKNVGGEVKGNILSFTTTKTTVDSNVWVVPNAFTPNNDGVNDTWKLPDLALYPNCTVNVFSRYGEIVYTAVGSSIEWDGKHNGINVPTGSYYYVIDLKNNAKVLSGNVTIIR